LIKGTKRERRAAVCSTFLSLFTLQKWNHIRRQPNYVSKWRHSHCKCDVWESSESFSPFWQLMWLAWERAPPKAHLNLLWRSRPRD
jgi:hypothetical protein